MNKRPIKKKNYAMIKAELDYFSSAGLLSAYQKERILEQYEIKNGLNFIRVLLVVGAILLGMGVLSFIASNWMYMGKAAKFFLILFSIAGVDVVGYKLEGMYPKTSRAMYYIGALLYGAGIFLIGQMFNLGGEFEGAMLLWALGIIPIGWFLKDVIILTFSTGLLSFYANAYFLLHNATLPYTLFVIIPVMYYINKKINYSKVLTFFLNALSMNLLALILLKILDFEELPIIPLLIFFVIGVVMVFVPVNEKLKGVFEFQGHLLHGITGIYLTFSEVWKESFFGEHFNIAFSILYFFFSLFLIKRGSLTSIVIVCALVLRFYIDISYDFLPKSMVFIIGGLILIGFGYYFENKRKKGGKNREQ